MTLTTNIDLPAVPAEEVNRRIDEYRRLGMTRKAPAQVVYQGSNVSCPWAGCVCKIAGIHFQLEKLTDPELYERLLTAWWQGPGLAGKCPGCGRDVLFSVTGKKAVADPSKLTNERLADDWHEKAHLVMRDR